MATIRTVNLLWERKFRGAYPLSRFALDDEGTLALAVPRPLEARTFDLTQYKRDGSVEVRAGFAVETLIKLEASVQSDNLIGMTADDVYLFQGASKSRFMPERRINFLDAALSGDGRMLATVFSDIAGASYAMAFGEIGGYVTWLREIDSPASTIAIARDGSRVALGAEAGTLWLLDAGRREVWEFAQDSPVRALCCSSNGQHVAYGTSDGKVGLIDDEGARLWETRLPGEIFAIALSASADLCAALCRHPENPAAVHIFCLDATGTVGWDFDSEKRLLGLAVSSDGKTLATGARDGTTTLYEVVPGEGTAVRTGAALEDPLKIAETQYRAGNLAQALQTLREALDVNPADCEGCDRLLAARDRYFHEAFAQGQTQLAQGQFSAAIGTLGILLHEEPLHIETAQALRETRQKRSEELIQTARTQSGAGDVYRAEMTLREAIAVAPSGQTPARVELASLIARHAADADAEADRLLAQGNLPSGLAALERAQSVASNPERARKIVRAHTAMEFAAGMTAYNEKRYGEAVFQFKKVLARDPAHTEAKRYLNFAQKFAQDATTESLTDRFSRLE